MKKTLLSTAFLIASGLVLGQGNVVVQVLSPASIETAYANVYATSGNSWGVADLSIPANSITEVLRLGRDGSAADSLGCAALVNGSEIAGKIAVIYRGTCGFSTKAINAQNAGAIGVLLISNSDNLAFTMLGGTVGLDVTIPVAMISQTSGTIIRPVMDVEDVTAFIGNNFGAFPVNLSMDRNDVLAPSALSFPPAIAANASEFQVELGAFVHNFGSDMITTARLRGTIMQGATEVYNNVSDNMTIAPGDSLFVELPQFNQPSYSGAYAIQYTLESDLPDAFPSDNVFNIPLNFGTVLSYTPVDGNGIPISSTHVAPGTPTGDFRTCIHFTDTNASRLTATGIYFSATTPTDLADPQDSVLTDLLVTAQAFLWTDEIANAFTLPSAAGLSTLTNGSYSYPGNLQAQHIFVPFDDPLVLEDNQRFLFCITTSETFFRHGWNDAVDYGTNADFFIDPTSMIQNGANWFNGFSNLAGSPSLGLQTVDNAAIGISENASRVELVPYPNPVADFLRIPMKGFTGTASLQMFDVTGAKVAERKASVAGDILTVDMTGITAGTYLFHMEFENGQRSDFRVVVAK